MNIRENVILKDYTTLKLGGIARYFCSCKNEQDILNAVAFAESHRLPILIIGGGSNLIIADNIPDILCIKIENEGIEILDENNEISRVRASAGHLWDTFVQFSVDHNLSGVEALSAIPGTVGATPVQNVGAYGSDVSQVIESVRGYNIETNQFEVISREECHFGYRDSVFKQSPKNKFIIESVIFILKKSPPLLPDYPRVSIVLKDIKKDFPDCSYLLQIRKTIQKIRSEKLPNPAEIPNVGSFFKNIIINKSTFEKLIVKYPEMPHYILGKNFKIPSGWLIEKAGYKGIEKNGVGTYQKNSLVLINIGNTETNNLLSFAAEIQKRVKEKFELDLEIEPETIYC